MPEDLHILESRVHQFHILRRRYLTNDSGSVVDYILRWLRYGKAIASNTQKPGEFEWRNSGKTLMYRDVPLQIDLLSVLAKKILDNTYSILVKKLCFNWDCMVLEVYDGLLDDRQSTVPEFSFLCHPKNLQKIKPAPDQLFGLAWTWKSPSWRLAATSPASISVMGRSLNRSVIRQYLGYHDIFREHLLILCFLLGGQPPRGTELLTVQFENTDDIQRHIYLVGGIMAIVTRYHKGQSRTGLEKEIPRFLPTRLRNMILAYLYFVQPFVLMLRRASELEVCLQNALMWGTTNDGAKTWDADKLSMILSQYSEKIIGFKLTLRNYRQIAIKIDQDVIRTPRHLRAEEDFAVEDDVDNEYEVHDNQAAHTSKTARLHYGVNLEEVLEENQSLWEKYRKVSRKWQQFLGIDDPSTISQQVGDTQVLHILFQYQETVFLICTGVKECIG